jgi:multiple sugar transport system permease protein
MKLKIIAKHSFAYLLILPTVLYLAVFQLYPLLESVRLSFTDTHLLRNTWHYVGLKNFSYLFTEDTHFWMITVNSLKWIFISLVGQFIIAFIVALVLNTKLIGKAFWRGLAMVPWMMPVVVVGLVWKWLFDYQHGLINFYLKHVGLISQSLNWFGDSNWVWPSLLFAAVWKGFGYLTVMILAGLKGIPIEVYESACVDGVNPFQKFWYITLPLLKPVLFVSGIVQIITGWTKFEMIWVLTNGGPGYATSILPTYIYTNSFSFYKMGLGSAVAVISTIVVALLLLIYYKVFRQQERSGELSD